MMTYKIREMTEDLERCDGGILAAWFIADPNGPTAISVGYVRRPEHCELFYCWHHFSGRRAWLIGASDRILEPRDEEWGDLFLNAMVRFGNSGLRPEAFNYGFFQDIPSAVVTNGNPAISEAFVDLTTSMTARRDWSHELFLINRYGPSLFQKANWIVRRNLEWMKGQADADLEKVAVTEDRYRDKPGFKDWALPDLPPVFTSKALVLQWFDIVSQARYIEHALWRISQMWAGAPEAGYRENINDLMGSGRYVSFRQMADFFERFHLPLWAKSWNDMTLQIDLRFNHPRTRTNSPN